LIATALPQSVTRPALHVAVAVCVLLAGCSLLGASHTREERATRALDNASATLDGTETYRFESEMSVVATADDRTERVDIGLTGAVDVGAHEMRTNATLEGETYRSYLLNRTVYQECAGTVWDWGTRETETNWSVQTPARRQLALLRSGSLYWNGTVDIDGESALLLTGEPTGEAITRYQERRSRSLLGGPSVENARMKVWLDPETSRPVKTDLRFEVKEGGNTATARVRSRFADYGTPVAVEVPTEARDDPLEMGCPG
jgi:hypothetical protein